jgi:hypothetical protein
MNRQKHTYKYTHNAPQAERTDVKHKNPFLRAEYAYSRSKKTYETYGFMIVVAKSQKLELP